jgi:hypothetical protein
MHRPVYKVVCLLSGHKRAAEAGSDVRAAGEEISEEDDEEYEDEEERGSASTERVQSTANRKRLKLI